MEFYLSVLDEEHNNPDFGDGVKKLLSVALDYKADPSCEGQDFPRSRCSRPNKPF